MRKTENVADQHVVILINYMRRHHVLAFEEFAKRVRKLTVLVSTPMEGDRCWRPEWASLNVVVQKNATFTFSRSSGFDEKNYVHIPWDTIWRLRQLKPDLILSYEMGMRTLFCSLYGMFRRNTPVVMVGNMSETLEAQRGLFRKLLRRLVKSLVNFCTYNGPSCKRYLKKIGVDDKRLIFFPYCFDRNKTFQGDKEFSRQGVRRLLFCGALSERKAVLPFTRILSEVCASELDHAVELLVAGDGPLRDQISNLGGRNLNIKLLGNCDSDKLRDCYATADVCVFPSFGDEWGLVPMEAWASGLPVLGSRYAQSIETICQSGENGWIFDPNSAEDTRQTIRQVLGTTPEQLPIMSRRARELVQKYTPVQSADQLCEVIDRAITRKNPGSPRTAAMLENRSAV